ncbi:unnamed protein product, partial [Rotaria sp. Silwood2]
MIDEINGLVEG